jgi:uncharacterized protein
MQARDLSEVLQINGTARPGVAPLEAREFSRLLALAHAHLVATGASGKLSGYLLAFHGDTPYDGEEFLSFRRTLAEPYIYIDQVAVAPAFEGTGVARALYQALESSARGQGIRLLCCEVNLRPSNARSRAFHEKQGFGSQGRLSMDDGREVLLMTKRLHDGREPGTAS